MGRGMSKVRQGIPPFWVSTCPEAHNLYLQVRFLIEILFS